MLEFFDVAEKTLDLVAAFVDILVELVVHLLSAFDLRLEVFDCAVDVAEGSLLSVMFAFLLFEVGFQLFGYVRMVLYNPDKGGDLPL